MGFFIKFREYQGFGLEDFKRVRWLSRRVLRVKQRLDWQQQLNRFILFLVGFLLKYVWMLQVTKQRMVFVYSRMEKLLNSCLQNLIYLGVVGGGVSVLGLFRFSIFWVFFGRRFCVEMKQGWIENYEKRSSYSKGEFGFKIQICYLQFQNGFRD